MTLLDLFETPYKEATYDLSEFTADIGGLAGLVLGLNLLSIITCLRRIFNYISLVATRMKTQGTTASQCIQKSLVFSSSEIIFDKLYRIICTSIS